jgi:hypothetical protein
LEGDESGALKEMQRVLIMKPHLSLPQIVQRPLEVLQAVLDCRQFCAQDRALVQDLLPLPRIFEIPPHLFTQVHAATSVLNARCLSVVRKLLLPLLKLTL